MHNAFEVRAPLSETHKFLLNTYPRDQWPTHAGFAQKTQGWMMAHEGFRQLGGINQDFCEAWLAKNCDDEKLVRNISRYGDLMVRSLHGHHTWEDHNFFPEIFAADARAERGIEILEQDHEALEETLDRITHHGNRVIKLEKLSPRDMHDDVAELRDAFEKVNSLLKRHLSDEEELIVPIILEYRLRG